MNKKTQIIISRLKGASDTKDFPWGNRKLVSLGLAINAVKQASKIPEAVRADIEGIITFYMEDEKTHWEENGKRDDHIYHNFKALQDYLKQNKK